MPGGSEKMNGIQGNAELAMQGILDALQRIEGLLKKQKEEIVHLREAAETQSGDATSLKEALVAQTPFLAEIASSLKIHEVSKRKLEADARKESRREGVVNKIIAVITVFFVPATFISVSSKIHSITK
jgi:hypothetical protein